MIRFLFLCAWMLLAGICAGQELREGTYPDGRLRYRGYFCGDRPCGEMTRFYPEGQVKAKLVHRGDTTDAVLYSRDGEFTCMGRYVARRKTGRWEYRRGDHLVAAEQYADDRLEGMAVRYFESGRESERKHWTAGQPEGEWVMYYPSGAVRMEARYERGRLHGLLKSYDRDGQLRTEGTYRNDLKEGTWRFYDAGGQLRKEVHYRAGVSDKAEEEELEESRRLDALVESARKIPDPAVFADDPEMYMKVTGEQFPEE